MHAATSNLHNHAGHDSHVTAINYIIMPGVIGHELAATMSACSAERLSCRVDLAWTRCDVSLQRMYGVCELMFQTQLTKISDVHMPQMLLNVSDAVLVALGLNKYAHHDLAPWFKLIGSKTNESQNGPLHKSNHLLIHDI